MSEDSIEAIGRWPWPRKWHAALTAMLSEYKPRMIIFDVVFSEKGIEENDILFRDAIEKAGDVYLGFLYNTIGTNYEDFYRGEDIESVLRPIPMFREAARGIGYVNVIPDSDGIIRRIPPIIDYENKSTYHISVISSMDLLRVKKENLRIDFKKKTLILKTDENETITVPLDRKGELIINWVARWGKAFKHYSYFDVIKSYKAIKEGKKPKIDLNLFRNKILLIGLTASALIDIKPIPIQNAYPAVGANAAIVNSFLTKNFIGRPKEKEEIALIYFISIVMSLLLFRVRPINGMMLTVLALTFYLLLSVFVFNAYGTWITVAYPIASILLCYVLIALYTQVAATIERNKLFREATRDGLTGLYNIRHFNFLFDVEFRSLKLNKNRKGTIIMSDIDNFKKINDTYGHQVGDAILRDVAKAFKGCCRQIDIVARYGGEEFVILLPGAGKKEALDVAERIRQSVESKKFKFKDKHYTVTVSIGLSEFEDDSDKNDMIRRADEALYRAKTTGKNKVVAA